MPHPNPTHLQICLPPPRWKFPSPANSRGIESRQGFLPNQSHLVYFPVNPILGSRQGFVIEVVRGSNHFTTETTSLRIIRPIFWGPLIPPIPSHPPPLGFKFGHRNLDTTRGCVWCRTPWASSPAPRALPNHHPGPASGGQNRLNAQGYGTSPIPPEK